MVLGRRHELAPALCAFSMHVLILANGDPPPLSLVQSMITTADIFVVTDGAANLLHDWNIVPDYILGDFDSIRQETQDHFRPDLYVTAEDQEMSDLDKALDFAMKLGAKSVTIAGSEGGRIDHSLTTFSLLAKYHSYMDIVVKNQTSESRWVSESAVISGNPGDTVSLVVFEEAIGVNLMGVKYPLTDARLTPGSRTVSNEMESNKVELTIEKGGLVVCRIFGD